MRSCWMPDPIAPSDADCILFIKPPLILVKPQLTLESYIFRSSSGEVLPIFKPATERLNRPSA
jgi:hypothetical protein